MADAYRDTGCLLAEWSSSSVQKPIDSLCFFFRIARNCRSGTEFVLTASQCPNTCRNRFAESSCHTADRVEGCVCPQGQILSGSDCVPEELCGCTYQDFYYPVSFILIVMMQSYMYTRRLVFSISRWGLTLGLVYPTQLCLTQSYS